MYRYVKKSQRIGCGIPCCNLRCGITQPILRLFDTSVDLGNKCVERASEAGVGVFTCRLSSRAKEFVVVRKGLSLSHQTDGDVLGEMSVRVDVPPYRQMVYSTSGGSRLVGPTKQLSRDGKTPAPMMGPLGIEKRETFARRSTPNRPTDRATDALGLPPDLHLTNFD